MKKIIILLVVLSISIVITGCFQGKESNSTYEVEKEGEQVTQTLSPKEIKQDADNYESASTNPDPSLCEKIKDDTMRGLCMNEVYYRLAILSSDATLCANITEGSMKLDCETYIGGI